ncbi:MAG: YCF48-related protein [Gammaproteobacteria bacterium]|nr:YCF48-related protein [Gammaproteobacteria bacterium]
MKTPRPTPITVSPVRASEISTPTLPSRRFASAGHLVLVVLLGLLAPGGAEAEEAAKAPLAIESLLLDGAVAGSRLVVVGERGHILVSSDDGASWTQAEVPTRVLLTAVHMHDERIGWSVGHDAVILRTGDGGETWTLVHQAPEEELPLLDVWFRDERTGFAVGAYGYFLVTEDSGETWTARAVSEDDFHLNALVPVVERSPESERPPTQRLYIAAEAGVAYRSDDGGKTWRELPSPYAGSWFGGLALDGNEVLLTGLRGHLFRSEDGGEAWTEVATGTQATLTAAIRLPSGSIVITGLEGSVLTSEDGGRSVSTRRLPSREGITAALPLADGGVLLVGEFGVRRLARDE